MVTCQICKNSYIIITNQHLIKHNTNTEQYLINYPNSILVSDEFIKKHSEITRTKYKQLSEEDKKNRYKSRSYSIESKEKIRQALISSKHKIDYKDPNRVNAISKAKKLWWTSKTKEERSAFFKEVVIPKTIKNIGYDKFVKKCRQAGLNGYNSIISKGIKKECNGFEAYMYSIIKQKGYEYIPQFEVEGWFYDCYIPEKNLIIEFDGDYWHADKEENCINDRLKNQWKIDRNKDIVAIKNGYNIIRIRESVKDDINSLI